MNYKETFKKGSKVIYLNEKATIVFVHKCGLVNLKIDDKQGYIFGVHDAYSLKKNNGKNYKI